MRFRYHHGREEAGGEGWHGEGEGEQGLSSSAACVQPVYGVSRNYRRVYFRPRVSIYTRSASIFPAMAAAAAAAGKKARARSPVVSRDPHGEPRKSQVAATADSRTLAGCCALLELTVRFRRL